MPRFSTWTTCIAIVFIAFASGVQADNSPRSQIPRECSTAMTCTPSMGSSQLDGPQQCVNHYTKKVIMIANWKNNKLDGAFSCADDNGLPMIEANFSDGQFDGEVRRYVGPREAGKQNNLWSSQQYRHGKPEGLSIVPRSNDGKRNIRFFVNGEQHGYELLVNPDGSIDRYFNCEVNGRNAEENECAAIAIPGFEKALAVMLAQKAEKRQSDLNRTVTQNYATGQLHERYTLVDGKYEGPVEVFFTNGKPESVTHYKKGKRHGLSRQYDEKSGAITAESDYLDDKAVEFKSFYLNGKLEADWKLEPHDHDLIRYHLYYDDGVLKEEGVRWIGKRFHSFGFNFLRSSAPHGERRAYDRNGSLESLSSYNKGQRDGLTIYYGNSNYIFEDYYEADSLKERKVRDRKTETVLRRTEYAADGSRLYDEKLVPMTPEVEQETEPYLTPCWLDACIIILLL